MLHAWYAMKVAKETSLFESIDDLGIPVPDVEALTGATLWRASDRYRLRRCMDSLMLGSLDVLGLAHFRLSAEFVAGWIALVVHPANHLVACAWYAGAQSAASILDDEPEHAPFEDGISAGRLLELVISALGEKKYGVEDFQHRLAASIAAGQSVAGLDPAVQKKGAR